MDWDALGAIGEIVGAAAVVLTLGYLAVQIRQTAKSSRQQSYADLVSRRLDIHNKIIESADVAEIIISGCRGEKLNEIEAQRFTSVMLNLVSHVQDVSLQRSNGFVEENVWLAERQQLAALIATPGFAGWWNAAKQYFTPEFVDEIQLVEPIPVVVMNQETSEWEYGVWDNA